jgi:integrase
MRAITHMAKKQKYLTEEPGEDVTMPQAKQLVRPVISRGQIQALLGAVEDLHDLCLLYIGIFCGPRSGEILGLQWKSWTGEALMPYGGRPTKGVSRPGRVRRRFRFLRKFGP